MFTDGTSRQQIAFQNLVIALMENGGLDPVILSSFMYVEDETSEKCVDYILETVSSISFHEYLFVYYSSLTKLSGIISVIIQITKLRHHLQRWKQVTAREFPDISDLLYMIPYPDIIYINNLGDGGTITTDTCNDARKVRRLLVKYIDGCVNEQDCMQHLRNMWINGVAKAVSKFMNGFLEDSLDNLSPFLCVSPDLENFIRDFHKEFSLDANYPKGRGENFIYWIIKKYPNEFIMKTERASGSRQDIIIMGSGPTHWNRILNVEFLDDYICIKDNTNILQQNIFTILTSI